MEEAFIAKLLASSGLTTLVGTRIQWDQRPQGNDLPAVTLSVISGAPLYTDEGNVGLSNNRVQIDCWASGSSSAINVARAVQSALSSVSMTQDGVEFQGVFPDSIQSFVEMGQGGAVVYRRSLDYDLWF